MARTARAAIAAAAALLLATGCATGLTGLAPVGLDRSCRTPMSAAATPVPAIRWAAISARDAAVIDAWCDTTGPPVVHATAARAGHGVASVPLLDELAVVSWNVHVGAGDLEALVARLRRGDFSGGRPVTRFVLLLQEVFRQSNAIPHVTPRQVRLPRAAPGSGQRRFEVVDLAGRLGLALYYAPSMRNGAATASRQDRGNAILSTEPLTDLAAIELPFERQRRVALAASIAARRHDGTVTPLRVVSVHLEVAASARRLWMFGRLRQRQVRELLATLPAAGPVIVGGDFNTWFGFSDNAYRTMAAAMPDAAAADRRPTFRRWLRLDHVFSRPPAGWSVRARRLDDAYGSDHYPLIAQFGVVAELAAEP
jgi:endonuclease/exonuclease/phosphatase family metal-dependent hydrolase